MPTSTRSTATILAAVAVGLAAVAGIIAYLQGFNAEEVACVDIAQARIDLQAAYDGGVTKSVEVYSDQKAMIDERLSACLNAEPIDPCEETQKARDEAVENYNSIQESSFGSFNSYFDARETAYQDYKAKKQALDACRQANPKPEGDVPYEKSDTKKCFDEYDAAVEAMRDLFEENTQTMRSALKNALAALDAREKACNPPTGKESFTNPPGGESTGGITEEGTTPPVELVNCRPLPEPDGDLLRFRAEIASLNTEITGLQETIDWQKSQVEKLKQKISDLDNNPFSITDENGQPVNDLRQRQTIKGERLPFYNSRIDSFNSRIQENESRVTELKKNVEDVKKQITEREAYIKKENEARQRAFPTNIHLAKPETHVEGGCAYYHCHGMLCGKPDPAPGSCGHGSTTETDVGCKEFFKNYLKAAGVY